MRSHDDNMFVTMPALVLSFSAASNITAPTESCQTKTVTIDGIFCDGKQQQYQATVYSPSGNGPYPVLSFANGDGVSDPKNAYGGTLGGVCAAGQHPHVHRARHCRGGPGFIGGG